jgi:uncharacterized membrane-anchored protein
MTATTFGETFADYFTHTLSLSYTDTSMVLIALFLVCLGFQLKVRTYWPGLFWAVMATRSSIAGTCVSDFIDRALGWGYPLGMGVLLSILLAIVAIWELSGEHMDVTGSMNRKAEAFVWATILVSNTLGTALGDSMADSLELGFGTRCGDYRRTIVHLRRFRILHKGISCCFVLDCLHFDEAIGCLLDLLTKSKASGGLDLKILQASMVILALFFVFFIIEMCTTFSRLRKS